MNQVNVYQELLARLESHQNSALRAARRNEPIPKFTPDQLNIVIMTQGGKQFQTYAEFSVFNFDRNGTYLSCCVGRIEEQKLNLSVWSSLDKSIKEILLRYPYVGQETCSEILEYDVNKAQYDYTYCYIKVLSDHVQSAEEIQPLRNSYPEREIKKIIQDFMAKRK